VRSSQLTYSCGVCVSVCAHVVRALLLFLCRTVESHLASNINKSRLVQKDLQVAKKLQEEEDLRAKDQNQKQHTDMWVTHTHTHTPHLCLSQRAILNGEIANKTKTAHFFGQREGNSCDAKTISNVIVLWLINNV